MARCTIACELMLLGAAAQLQVAPPPAVEPVALPVNEAPVRLSLTSRFTRLDGLAGGADARYAMASIPVRSDVPLLVVIAHDQQATLSARVLDAPPWASPRVAQPIRFETRRSWNDRSRDVMAGAWIIAAPASRARQAVLLIEAHGGGRREISVALYDPSLPAAGRSLARLWGRGAPAQLDLPSPLERVERSFAQQLREWPDEPAP